MKRAYRLRRPDQFQRVRREGRSWEHSLLILNAMPNRRRVTRCGFVVTKRMGGAVERNRVRRRVREAVRLAYPSLLVGWDLVFVLRSKALIDMEFDRIQSAIEQLLRRASVWNEQTSDGVPQQ